MPFVRDAWNNAAYKHLEASLYLSKHGKKPSWVVWKTLFPPIIDQLLSRAETHVACPIDTSDQILAFSVTEKIPDGTLVLHWVSTKKKLWRHGLAELLLRERGFLPDAPAVFSFAGSAYSVLKDRIEQWDYVPFWLFALGKQG